MEKVEFVKDINLLELELRDQLINFFPKNGKIAVKVHMGETNNKYYLKPNIIKSVVDVLKTLGLKPFLFDSPAKYVGGRDTVDKYLATAKKHGFSEEDIGCPIIVSDESIDVETNDIIVGVCSDLINADGVLVLTHVKGHPCCGIGGSIKNLGMGCVSKEAKGIIHDGGKPVFVNECFGCGVCAKFCPAGCIDMDNGRANMDLDSCMGCSTCIINCSHNVLKPSVALFDNLLAQGAFAVLSSVKKIFFVNFLIDIAKLCDCCDNAGDLVVEDIGILLCEDIIEIDTASFDLINAEKRDVFKELHHHDPYLQINFLRKLLLEEDKD